MGPRGRRRGEKKVKEHDLKGRNFKERSRNRRDGREGKGTQGKRVTCKESTWMGSGGCVPGDWGRDAYQ